MNKILRRIMETGGMTEAMEKDIERLKDDFDEREGILRRYGETYDGEDRDDYEFSERRREDDAINVYTPREEEKDWRQMYDDMRERYLNRFFGGRDFEDDRRERYEYDRRERRDMPSVSEEYDRIMRETEADVKRDGTPQTFDELLERTEPDEKERKEEGNR